MYIVFQTSVTYGSRKNACQKPNDGGLRMRRGGGESVKKSGPNVDSVYAHRSKLSVNSRDQCLAKSTFVCMLHAHTLNMTATADVVWRPGPNPSILLARPNRR